MKTLISELEYELNIPISDRDKLMLKLGYNKGQQDAVEKKEKTTTATVGINPNTLVQSPWSKVDANTVTSSTKPYVTMYQTDPIKWYDKGY